MIVDTVGPAWLHPEAENHRQEPFSRQVLEYWSNLPTDVGGAWADLDVEYKHEWMHLVRLKMCAREKPFEPDPEGTVYEMDGSLIVDKPSFHIALGEAINGPRGYFGGCWNATNDCLCGGFGAPTEFTVIWRDADVARSLFPNSLEDREHHDEPWYQPLPFEEYLELLGGRVVLS